MGPSAASLPYAHARVVPDKVFRRHRPKSSSVFACAQRSSSTFNRWYFGSIPSPPRRCGSLQSEPRLHIWGVGCSCEEMRKYVLVGALESSYRLMDNIFTEDGEEGGMSKIIRIDRAGNSAGRLSESEQRLAKERNALRVAVIHEAIRTEGEADLQRPSVPCSGRVWRGELPWAFRSPRWGLYNLACPRLRGGP
jgi:hypothetical protein